MNAEATIYDTVAYRGFAYLETHPARLATVASLYGMEPAPPSRCRVLELGCGVGANLIPMAVQYPDSEFVGIDLSATSIERGQSAAASFVLRNITLRHADIMAVDKDYGPFDYIIAHGVYSWVPPEIREKVLAIYHQHLTPQGVAYVSYNAHPGAHLRDMVRDMMHFHIGGLADPQERIGQARAIVKAIAEASRPQTAHGVALRDQLARIERKSDDALLHDELNEDARPFLLHEVATAAGRHGLQYLSDTSIWRSSVGRLPETMQALLSQFSAESFVARDQFIDFIEGHGFRRTLLCHAGVRLDRAVGPGHLKRYYLAGSIVPVSADADPGNPGLIVFKDLEGQTLETDHALTKAALMHLNERWPEAVSFDELRTAACGRLMAREDMRHACSAEEIELMTEALFGAVNNGFIEFYLFPTPCVGTISDRPQVSPFIHQQLKLGPMIVNLRHDSVSLDSEPMRRFIGVIDGTRDLDQLTADFKAMMAQSPSLDVGTVTRDLVAQNLKKLARLAILVR